MMFSAVQYLPLNPTHVFTQSAFVLKLFLFPWQPPYMNSSHFPVFLLKKNLGKAALHGPIFLLSLQRAGRAPTEMKYHNDNLK